MFRKLTSGVALVTTLSLSLSGLVFSPAHADSPADGYYVCTTGQLRAEEDNSLAYTITNGVVTTGGSCAGTVVIPAGVTRIENGAFYGASALTSITIPESVTSIGTYAFGFASALNSVNIPGSVTSIGASAFYGASALTSITIPGSVTNVSSNMLLNASALTSVTISEGVTVIDGGAFWGASALTSITIPSSITRIESNAFNLTSALKDYYFSGNGPSTVREDSFAGVASGAKAHISATATGFGTDPTWPCH